LVLDTFKIVMIVDTKTVLAFYDITELAEVLLPHETYISQRLHFAFYIMVDAVMVHYVPDTTECNL
jgi:hypothetical protein